MNPRKRQSRIAFTPLPSSSPAAEGYNRQIQDRAAAVSLEPTSSPSKRRKLRHGDLSQLDGANDSIPTPAASLEQGEGSGAHGDSDSEPIAPSQKRRSTQKKRSRQQQLDFTNGRDADSFSSPLKLTSSPRLQSSSRPGIFSSSQRRRPTFDISSDESEEELLSPGKLVKKADRKPITEAGKKKASNGRVTRGSQATITQPIPVESDSDDNIVVSKGKPDLAEVESEDENDEDDMPTTVGKQKRRRARRASPDSFISSSPPQAIESDDDVQIIENPRNRRSNSDSGNNESEDEPVTPSRRLLKRSKKHQREKEELDDDIDYLEPSSDVENSARKPRNTQTAEKSKRQSALEQLRRKRLGKPVESEPEENEVDPDESGAEGQAYSEDEIENAHPKPMSSAQAFKETEDDRDFIEEEDEDQTLGAPDEAIPIQFTNFASMKPKELFKYAVEWMVQKKVNPAFNARDQLYDLTFRKLDDEVKGLAGSKFESSVWRPGFAMALRSRPDIAYEPIDRNSAEHFMRDWCAACGRTNHPATYQIQFQGKPYNGETLEEVAGNDYDEGENESSSNDEDNHQPEAGDQPAYDAKGREIPPENTIYYVGKFCQANAQTAHALYHWRFHLNEWVVNWLTQQGYNTPAKIVQRDQWSTKKRRKHANKIVDRMEEEGVVKTLWHDFSDNIREARDSKQGRY